MDKLFRDGFEGGLHPKKPFGRKEVEAVPELSPEEEETLKGLKARQKELSAFMKAGEGVPADRALLEDIEKQIAALEARAESRDTDDKDDMPLAA